MGMVCGLTAISSAALDQMRHDDEFMEATLFPEDESAEPEHHLYLDKAWHGIQYLLTGEAWGGAEPLAWAVLGGEEFGPDIGYGPARFLTPTQVTQIATALAGISERWLAARFNPMDMQRQEIYPDIWVRDGADALAYLMSYYRSLADFYRDAAARGDAVVQCLS